jgi:putative restriction endonuclease
VPERRFGHVDGVPVGSVFADRRALALAGVHRPLRAGISGSEAEGADSIVVSGGYEDDQDHGDVVIYTGHGGQDGNGVQVQDQEWTRGNLALVVSEQEGLPVRVIRGANADSLYSPESGFRYEGLFYVESSWREPGRRGFQVCRFRLRRMAQDGTPIPLSDDESSAAGGAGSDGPAPRAETTVQRIVRSTEVIRKVKRLHGHRCQICGAAIALDSGEYAEGAHIRPLGKPHNGPDTASNVLCLCPNDHVRFDYGAIVVDEQLIVLDNSTGAEIGHLRTAKGHPVDSVQLAYHRARFGRSAQ